MRLTFAERKYLRLLEAALEVSEYTDKIDILTYTSKNKRILAQIRELCAILSGLVMAADFKLGQDLFKDRGKQWLPLIIQISNLTKSFIKTFLSWGEGTRL